MVKKSLASFMGNHAEQAKGDRIWQEFLRGQAIYFRRRGVVLVD
jgi:hypothetical protein